ncbi:eCIS core domain-containing protein [Nostoc sp.]|uniref:eCIS core domain-containing protein n=1 Tax=Nostoc sp. TaxID=1180 RepID=UPI002FFC3C21
MREHISRQKKTTTGFSIPSLKHPTRGFGLESSAISRQAVPEIQPLHKPLTHDISRIPLRTQAKLSISQPGDIYEQEADSVAQQVMQRMAQPVNRQSIQREALPKDEEELQMKPLDNSTLQREEAPEEEEELQMKSLDISTLQREEAPEDEEELQMKPMVQRQGEAGIAAAPDLEASINQARGGGQTMANNIREPMEQAFSADFSRVKVHTDGQSDQLNRSIQARAFTTGQDVFFRQGEYNPGSRGGQELLAHELTHVVQQSGGAISSEEKRGKKLINLVENTGHERASPKNGKDGDQAEKLKGEDYANNVQKLLNDLNNLLPGFTNGEIDTALSIINSNRAQCSVSTSQVTGKDTNTLAYSNLKNAIVQQVTDNKYLPQEANRKHFRDKVRNLVSVLIPLIDQLPTTAVDTRVAKVIESESKLSQQAKLAIDAALVKLSEEMKKRLKEYFQNIFDKKFISKKDNDPKEPPPGGGTGGGVLVR